LCANQASQNSELRPSSGAVASRFVVCPRTVNASFSGGVAAPRSTVALRTDGAIGVSASTNCLSSATGSGTTPCSAPGVLRSVRRALRTDGSSASSARSSDAVKAGVRSSVERAAVSVRGSSSSVAFSGSSLSASVASVALLVSTRRCSSPSPAVVASAIVRRLCTSPGICLRRSASSEVIRRSWPAVGPSVRSVARSERPRPRMPVPRSCIIDCTHARVSPSSARSSSSASIGLVVLRSGMRAPDFSARPSGEPGCRRTCMSFSGVLGMSAARASA
jgi:hypothetical protein